MHLTAETSRGPGGCSDYPLWMEMWVRASRDGTVRLNYFLLWIRFWTGVVLDTTPQFVTVLDPGLTGRSV